LWGGPAGTDWTIDNGGKALVIQGLADYGEAWIRYPAQRIDPEFRFFPQPLRGGEPYGALKEGHVQSQYDSPFVRASVPAFVLAGERGLAFLPALGGGAAVFLTGLQGIWAAVILLLATPLLFYSSVLWEHTWVMALTAGSFLLLSRAATGLADGRAFTAGIALGAAIHLREEMLLLFGGTLAAMAIVRRDRREIAAFAAGGAIGIAALATFHVATTGSITGTHVAANRPVFLAHAWDAVRGLLFSTGFSGILVAVPVVALILLVAARGMSFRGHKATEIAALALFAGTSVLAFARYPSGEDKALALIHSNSVLVAVPWMFPALVSRGVDRERLALLSALIFIGLFLLFVPERSITGIHPGPRMLLPIAPIAAIAAAHQVQRDFRAPEAFARARLILLLLLLGIAAAWSARSIALLVEKREVMGRIASELEHDPRRVVVTDLFWLPTELPSLWNEKQFHLIAGPSELRELQGRYARGGENELLFVTTAGSIRNRAPLRTIESASFPNFSIELHAIRP
jgi:hypothetical protein